MKKSMGAVCAVFAGLLALLTGCPTDTVIESGEEYVAEAVVINEKAKYKTAIVFELDESDEGTDVTDQLIQLSPGKNANHDVQVSISNAGGNYFSLYNGRLVFTGRMPPNRDAYEESRAELVAAIDVAEDDATKAFLQFQLDALGGVPNTEVITLSFRKGEASAALNVLAVIDRRGEEQPERNVADVRTSFLIYGYDVIHSSYINREDVKRNPILDADSVDAAQLIVRDSGATSSKWTSASGESVKELLEKINVTASAEYKGVLFSGKVSQEFSTNSSSKQTYRYAKGQGFQIVRQDFLANGTARSLQSYLDPGFITAVNSDSAASILNSYGTHLITSCILGGEAEFNYSYFGTELDDATKMSTALNATYAAFSGEASAGYETQKKELKDNSDFNYSSRGGNSTSFKTVEEFLAGYDSWVASVKTNPDLCGVPNLTNNLLPIWELAALINPVKAAAIQQEFEDMISVQGSKLDGFTYQPEKSYITALDVFMYAGLDAAPTSHNGYTNLVKSDMYSPDRGVVYDFFSVQALRDFLITRYGANFNTLWDTMKKNYLPSPQPYLAYLRTAANPHDAIAELKLSTTTTSLGAGWQVINVNLHESGFTPLYLHYRKVNQNDVVAIDFIGCYQDISEGSGEILSGYEWVNGVNTGRVSLSYSNVGAILSGKIGQYLTVHKAPFKW
jgi:hypothetical protein